MSAKSKFLAHSNKMMRFGPIQICPNYIEICLRTYEVDLRIFYFRKSCALIESCRRAHIMYSTHAIAQRAAENRVRFMCECHVWWLKYVVLRTTGSLGLDDILLRPLGWIYMWCFGAVFKRIGTIKMVEQQRKRLRCVWVAGPGKCLLGAITICSSNLHDCALRNWLYNVQRTTSTTILVYSNKILS